MKYILMGTKSEKYFLDPGATDYTKTVLYTSYDVTKNLQTGANCLGFILGNGWYWVGYPRSLRF